MKSLLIVSIAVLLQLSTLSLQANNNAYLGVYLEDLTQAEREELNLDYGVRIDMVIADSPAEKSGLSPDDIIISIDKVRIITHDDVRSIIEEKSPGDKIIVEVITGSGQKTINLTLGDVNSVDLTRLRLSDTKTKHIGVKLQSLTGQLKDYFQTDNGVLIAEVLPGSPADKAGLRAGDIILIAEGELIDDVKDLKTIIQNKDKGDMMAITFLRDGEKSDIEVEIAETDDLFSMDLNNEIIFLGRMEFDLSEIEGWFQSLFSDSTRKELEQKIQRLQNEIEKIKRDLLQQK